VSAQAASAQLRPASTLGEVGMWVFLASEVLFFNVLLFGYLVTRLHHPQGFALASRHTDVVLGSINTAVLLTTSLTVALAGETLKRDRGRACARLLAATFVLGIVFLAVKLLEYTHDYHQHLVPWLSFSLSGEDLDGARLFFLMYFVMTGAHAVHLLAGLGLIAFMAVATARGRITVRNPEPVEVSGLYWHLIDIVWIFLYPLLYLVART
jgi:cytochrome c oxidase subunit III